VREQISTRGFSRGSFLKFILKFAPEVHVQFNEEARSPFFRKHKTIIHPGE
ncbi:hypothetical protein Droror1_Dr00012508, partial [Drosera rotundifolia]